MPNQRAVAAAAGVTQSTVSLALRGHRGIPEATRQRVQAAAARLGYSPSPYVNSLMAHIKRGKLPSDKGCIAILIDAESEQDWAGFTTPTYLRQRKGMFDEAEKMGFHAECFYLRAPHMDAKKLDRIWTARGIVGLILMTPYLGTKIPIDWSRYAISTISYSWTEPQVDSVSSRHLGNVDMAFEQALARGYRRIGMCLPHEVPLARAHDWYMGFTWWQARLPKEQQVRLLRILPDDMFPKFARWIKKWRPDVLITLFGWEDRWLAQMGMRIPEDIGMICMNRPIESPYAGTEENHEVIGAAAVELVASRIMHNNFGLPEHPRLTLIAGTWTDGNSLRPRQDATASVSSPSL
jgi:LacI family transcriptional regulator